MSDVTGVSGVGDDTVQQAADVIHKSRHETAYDIAARGPRRVNASDMHIAEALSAAGLLAVPAAPAATVTAVTVSVEQADVIAQLRDRAEQIYRLAGRPGRPDADLLTMAANALSRMADVPAMDRLTCRCNGTGGLHSIDCLAAANTPSGLTAAVDRLAAGEETT